MYSLSAEKNANAETTEAAPSLCITVGPLRRGYSTSQQPPGSAIHQRCQQSFALRPPPHLQPSSLMARPHVAGAHHSNTHGRLTGDTLGVYCTSYGKREPQPLFLVLCSSGDNHHQTKLHCGFRPVHVRCVRIYPLY